VLLLSLSIALGCVALAIAVTVFTVIARRRNQGNDAGEESAGEMPQVEFVSDSLWTSLAVGTMFTEGGIWTGVVPDAVQRE
jgi:ABC-type spermidine/putrescine transport system permease subunit II